MSADETLYGEPKPWRPGAWCGGEYGDYQAAKDLAAINADDESDDIYDAPTMLAAVLVVAGYGLLWAVVGFIIGRLTA